MWDLGLTSDQIQSGAQNRDTMNGIQYCPIRPPKWIGTPTIFG